MCNTDLIDQHLANIESLNSQINAIEEDMVSLKARYEGAVKERNAVGVHLLDRNDELCSLYEKLNIQQDVMKKGEIALQEREDELRKQTLLASELRRKIELEKQLLPKCSETNQRISRLRGELAKVRKQVSELSSKMEASDDPKRCRHLKGTDPKRVELNLKIQNLENLLAEKEVCILHLCYNSSPSNTVFSGERKNY
jgi:chromosome segregation ATPase